ncbi:helix-turn-helix transcriptional regulator [Amycolatopsis eburnea]|uniref:helix-turn-helix transcriptional regulator n=1 Tax=Amycolatopsis eburnea TaxID=2267691 RepID=UPI00131598F3|nr:LuxR family transcriptional regulator [Amycolatopsis eburnea]
MLFEREAQEAALAGALRQDGGVVAVRGETGTGRTALLRLLGHLATGRGARVLRAGGAPAERDFPFGVVRQLVLPLHGEAALPPLAAKLLQSAAGPGCDDAVTLHGLHVLLVSLAARKPVVVLVDDVRWADEPSLRALAFLAGRLRGTRVLLGVVLPDAPRAPALQELARAAGVRARPLSADGTRRVAAARIGAGLEPAFATACHELTGGRPKELDELLSRAFAQRLTGRAADCVPLRDLGAALRRERLRLLVRREPEVEALARAVVTLGRHAEPELVTRLAGLDAAACAEARALLGDAWLSTAVDGRLVPEPALVRVVEETRSAASTAEAHRAAAALLTAQGFPPEHVAAQLLSVDTLRGDEDIATLRTAAVAAQRRGAPDLAARYLRRALLDVPPGDPGRARLLTELAAAEPDPRAAVRYLVQAAPLLPPGRERAEAVARIPLTAAARGPLVTELVRAVTDPGKPEAAERGPLATHHARAVTDPGEPEAAAREPLATGLAPTVTERHNRETAATPGPLATDLAHTDPRKPKATTAILPTRGPSATDPAPTVTEPHDRETAATPGPLATELARTDPDEPEPAACGTLVTEQTHPTPNDPDLAPRLEARDWFTALEDPGRPAAAAERLRRLPDRPTNPGDRELRAVLLLTATLGGRITADEAARHASLLLDHEPASTVRAGTALRIVPLVLIAAGRPDSVTSWLASAGGPRASTATRVLVDVHQALALLARGRFAEAGEPAQRAFRAADPGSYDVLALPATTLALVADSARSRELARQVLDGLPDADDLAVFAVRRGLQGMLAARENPDAALAQFLDRGRLLDRAGWRNPAIYAWRGSAALLARRLGRIEQARQLAEEHHRHSVAWGAPALVGRSLRVLAALGGRRQAVELLREAVELLDGAPDELEAAKACADLGTCLRETEPEASRRWLARARELAESCGAGRLEAREDGTHAELPRPAAELTAGEATVGRLAAGGRTNTEIAVELSISRRAVEKHLTSLYRKLKIDGRAQLASVLDRR